MIEYVNVLSVKTLIYVINIPQTRFAYLTLGGTIAQPLIAWRIQRLTSVGQDSYEILLDIRTVVCFI
jgi:hypothetical protein